jgi:hypothetical protein
MRKTYSIKANRTAADVVKNNDITLETGYTLEEARIASLEYQRQGGHVAVWIEEEKPPKTPRITRSIEQDNRGNKFSVTRCDGWMI